MLDASLHIVVFSTPTEELVREAVDLGKVLGPHRNDTAKEFGVRQDVAEGVDGRTDVPGMPLTSVQVTRIFRKEVHIMEKEAAVVVPLHRFHEPDVEQLSPVEGTFTTLFDDEDGVLHVLLLQKRVYVLEE